MLNSRLVSRYFNYVSIGLNDTCWPWQGSRYPNGYGRLGHGSARYLSATHLALEIAGLPRPNAEACALHHCDNPICQNPLHLYWGTRLDNANDREKRGRVSKEARQRGAAGLQQWWSRQPPGARSAACRKGTMKVNEKRWGFHPVANNSEKEK
jgi:hypothetical protein